MELKKKEWWRIILKNLILKLSTQPFEGTLLEKVTCFGEFFQLSVAVVKFLLNKLGMLSNAKKLQSPSHSWKRKRRRGDGLFFLLFKKKRKRESFG